MAAVFRRAFPLLPGRQPRASDDRSLRRRVRTRLPRHRRPADAFRATPETVGTHRIFPAASRQRPLPPARTNDLGRRPISNFARRIRPLARGASGVFPQGMAAAGDAARGHRPGLRNHRHISLAESRVGGAAGNPAPRRATALSRISTWSGDGRGHLPFPPTARWRLRRERHPPPHGARRHRAARELRGGNLDQSRRRANPAGSGICLRARPRPMAAR